MSLPALHPDIVSIATLAAVLLAVGYLMFSILSFVPVTAKGTRDSWPSLFSATFTAAVVLGAFLIGGKFLSGILVLLAARVGYEASIVAFARTPAARTKMVAFLFSCLTAASCLLALSVPLPQMATVLAIAFLAAAAGLLVVGARGPVWVKITLEILLFPLLPVLLFAAAANTADLGALILGSYLLVETFDSYALLGGKAIGKTKVFPVLSPKKTAEGLGIGAIMTLLTVIGVALVYQPDQLGLAIVIAFVSVILTVAGDLAASRLKRESNVKDYPVLLKRQGGLLDIMDAWITTGAGIALIMAWL